MLNHENHITRQYWLPQEPYLWVISLGNHEIDFDYDAAMLRATG
jgi:hypothetical protein